MLHGVILKVNENEKPDEHKHVERRTKKSRAKRFLFRVNIKKTATVQHFPLWNPFDRENCTYTMKQNYLRNEHNGGIDQESEGSTRNYGKYALEVT